jgi:hypothetical protein
MWKWCGASPWQSINTNSPILLLLERIRNKPLTIPCEIPRNHLNSRGQRLQRHARIPRRTHAPSRSFISDFDSEPWNHMAYSASMDSRIRTVNEIVGCLAKELYIIILRAEHSISFLCLYCIGGASACWLGHDHIRLVQGRPLGAACGSSGEGLRCAFTGGECDVSGRAHSSHGRTQGCCGASHNAQS